MICYGADSDEPAQVILIKVAVDLHPVDLNTFLLVLLDKACHDGINLRIFKVFQIHIEPAQRHGLSRHAGNGRCHGGGKAKEDIGQIGKDQHRQHDQCHQHPNCQLGEKRRGLLCRRYGGTVDAASRGCLGDPRGADNALCCVDAAVLALVILHGRHPSS